MVLATGGAAGEMGAHAGEAAVEVDSQLEIIKKETRVSTAKP